MALVSGLGTVYNLPNYYGELFLASPNDTPLLSLMGGIGGAQVTQSTLAEWQAEDLRDPSSRPRLEGADAPTAEERSRSNHLNVTQIFQEQVATSYSKQAATRRYETALATGSENPVPNEHDHQVALALRQVARDINYTFWNSTLVNPADNATAREMSGFVEAIKTGPNFIDNTGAPVAISKAEIDALVLAVYNAGGISESETATLFVPPALRGALTDIYVNANATSLFQESRTVAGVTAQTLLTDFGTLNVVVDRMMPSDAIVLASVEQLNPVFLEIPGKGLLFEEELAKTGASDKTQLYGELTLKYGTPTAHGINQGLTAS